MSDDHVLHAKHDLLCPRPQEYPQAHDTPLHDQLADLIHAHMKTYIRLGDELHGKQLTRDRTTELLSKMRHMFATDFEKLFLDVLFDFINEDAIDRHAWNCAARCYMWTFDCLQPNDNYLLELEFWKAYLIDLHCREFHHLQPCAYLADAPYALFGPNQQTIRYRRTDDRKAVLVKPLTAFTDVKHPVTCYFPKPEDSYTVTSCPENLDDDEFERILRDDSFVFDFLWHIDGEDRWFDREDAWLDGDVTTPETIASFNKRSAMDDEDEEVVAICTAAATRPRQPGEPSSSPLTPTPPPD